jgi:hypothetical protein
MVRTEGPKVYEQLVAAPPEQVTAAWLRAISAVGAKAHKDEELHIETEDDRGVRQAIQQMNNGTVLVGEIDLRESVKDKDKVAKKRPATGRRSVSSVVWASC